MRYIRIRDGLAVVLRCRVWCCVMVEALRCCERGRVEVLVGQRKKASRELNDIVHCVKRKVMLPLVLTANKRQKGGADSTLFRSIR